MEGRKIGERELRRGEREKEKEQESKISRE